MVSAWPGRQRTNVRFWLWKGDLDALTERALPQRRLLDIRSRDVTRDDLHRLYEDALSYWRPFGLSGPADRGTTFCGGPDLPSTKENFMPDHNPPGTVDDYRNFLTIPTRWMDNDVYGHVNNVQYYSYFDTAVNSYLIDQGVLDIQTSDVIGLVVETQCRYFDGFTFPDQIRAGIRVAHIGTSSVRYEVGLFNGKTKVASAEGYFIHVYVERQTRRPTKIPAPTRTALEKIAV